MQGGIVRFYRDQPAGIPVALFSTRNIIKGSFSVDYILPTSSSADVADVGYFDENFWAQKRVLATLPGSAGLTKAKIETNFITNRLCAHREGIYQTAASRYRRKVIKFSTEMDGFIPSFGDLIMLQHNMPACGPGGEVVAVETTTNLLTYAEDFSNAAWTKLAFGSGLAPVVTPNAGESPRGDLTADLVVFDPNGTTSSDTSRLSRVQSGSTVIGQPAAGAFWIKTADGSTKSMSVGLYGHANSTVTGHRSKSNRRGCGDSSGIKRVIASGTQHQDVPGCGRGV